MERHGFAAPGDHGLEIWAACPPVNQLELQPEALRSGPSWGRGARHHVPFLWPSELMLAHSPVSGLLRGLDPRDGRCVPCSPCSGSLPPCAGGRERGKEGGIHGPGWAGPCWGQRATGQRGTEGHPHTSVGGHVSGTWVLVPRGWPVTEWGLRTPGPTKRPQMSHKPCPMNNVCDRGWCWVCRPGSLGSPWMYGAGTPPGHQVWRPVPKRALQDGSGQNRAWLAFPKGEGDLECGTQAPGGLGHEGSGSAAAAGANHPGQPQGEVHPVRVLLSYMLSKFGVSSSKREFAEKGLLGEGWAEIHTVLKPSRIPWRNFK